MIAESVTQFAIEIMERGLVPDSITRRAMRKLCETRLRELRADSRFATANFIRRASAEAIALLPEKANQQHYEVPAEFFGYALGKHRKYSSCYWAEGVNSLDEAEAESLRLTCEHADLCDGHHILELGCGWGSLTLWMAQRYPQCRVTAISNSSSQREYILQQAKARGLAERVTVLTADMNDFETARTFDRVVSVEMFEHMRNHGELLRRISNWMKPDAKLFVHIFCHQQFAYPFDGEGAADWMSRNFFSGGMMPSVDLLPSYDQHLRVVDKWIWDGRHYERTANAWVAEMDRNRSKILAVFEKLYGASQAKIWFQRWRMLFMAGAELFGYREGSEWFVAHYRFEKKT